MKVRGWAVTQEGAQADGRTRIGRRAGARLGPCGRGAWIESPPPVDVAVYRVALGAQVRQDLWRALRDLRGFHPVVEIETEDGPEGLAVRVAAGAADGAVAAGAQVVAAAEALLGSAPHRARWRAWALRQAGGARARAAGPGAAAG